MDSPWKSKLDSRIFNLFKAQAWTDDNSISYNLEKYKFLPRDEIIQILISFGYEDINSIDKCPEVVTKEELKITKVLDDSRFVITRHLDGSIRFICDLFSQQNLELLKLQTGLLDASIAYVTPYNLDLLKNYKSKFSYPIMLKSLVLDCKRYKGRDLHITVETYEGVPTAIAEYRTPFGMERSHLFKLTMEDNHKLVTSCVEQLMSSAVPADLDTEKGLQSDVMDVFWDTTTSLRVSTIKLEYGYRMVSRIQDISTTTMRIPDLGFDEKTTKALFRNVRKNSGATFICGAMNTGKNTTMFAMAHELVGKKKSGLSITSPREAWVPMSQVDYKDSIPALLSIVKRCKKQDLDYVMINELPSAEVAKAAMDLVTSDVHVFTSFHLSRLWYLPLRLEEFFGKDFKTIFLQLNTVYNQKMFTKLCPHCKRKLAVSELDEERREFLEGRHVDFYFENAGCSICSDPKNREIQPFAEHLYFTEEIVDTLLDIDHTFEMVRYLKKLMISSGETIDDKVCRAISEGVLGIEALDLIL